MRGIRTADEHGSHRVAGLLALAALLIACGADQTGPVEQTLDPSTLRASAVDGEPGVPTEVVVEARDTGGRPFLGPLPGLQLDVRGENPTTVEAAVRNGDGTHSLSYTPERLGTDTLIATMDGALIQGTPWASRVRIVWRAGSGTATLDGTVGAGEWDAAPEYPVFGGPALAGSTARFMADETDLYVLITYPGEVGSVGVRFDNTLDLLISGDDVIGGGATSFSDAVHGSEGIRPDTARHGAAAGTVAATGSVLELRHPLDSGDPQDIALDPSASVGVCLQAGLGGASADISEPDGCILVRSQQKGFAELVLP